MNKKIVAIGFLGILLLMCTATAYTLEYNTLNSLENDPTYAGHMSVDPGDPVFYDNWELIAEVNPDFGGENKTFNLEHGESITLTATFEITEDSPLHHENWKFTLYTYGWKDGHWDPIKYALKEVIDVPGPDNSGTGDLSVTIVCDKYDKIFAKLWIDYWRLGWTGSEDAVNDTDEVDINIIGNQAPKTPIIKGPYDGIVGEEYTYTFMTTDPEGDDIFYWVEWGDETNSGWIGPYASGKETTISHIWQKPGKFYIKAKAKDDYNGAESYWATFEVKMPRNRAANVNSFFFSLLEKFPLLERLLSSL